MSESAAGPNRVGLDWFRANRGKKIQIESEDGSIRRYGVLLRWDLYNVLIREDKSLDNQHNPSREVLIKQGPGMVFRPLEEKKS